MIFELNIEYEKRINDIYSKVTARQTYNATSTAELDRALKTALKLITEKNRQCFLKCSPFVRQCGIIEIYQLEI
jgi:hypothetical protein